jgi:hypothetical protein
MIVQTQAPIHDKNQLKAWLEQRLPGHKILIRGPVVIVGTGAATGVLLKPSGPGQVKMPWAFPNIGVQMLVTLSILAGILPGLLVFLSVWLSVKGGVDQLRANLTQVLQSGQPLGGGMAQPMGMPQGAYGQHGYQDPGAYAQAQGGYGQGQGQGGYDQGQSQGGYGQGQGGYGQGQSGHGQGQGGPGGYGQGPGGPGGYGQGPGGYGQG